MCTFRQTNRLIVKRNGLIAKRNVAFIKQGATIVSETQVCNFERTVCKRNASFAPVRFTLQLSWELELLTDMGANSSVHMEMKAPI